MAAQTVTLGDFMMFRYLGRFGVLAVCLFAIVLVMGGCNREDPPPDKPVEIVTPPPPVVVEEKTFKEQLVEGQWRMVHLDVKNGARFVDPDGLVVLAKDWADTFTRALGLPYTGRVSQNSLRFEDSGKVVIILGCAIISDPGLPELGLILTMKGSYQIAVDLGSSATITLSITEVVWDVKPDAGGAKLAELEFNINDEIGGAPGEVIRNGRGSIDGDQLRLGSDIIAERVN